MYAPAWTPTAGDVIRGVVVDLDRADTQYQAAVPIVTVDGQAEDPESGDTRVAVWCSPTVLRNEMEKARPQIGDLIAVSYLGPIYDTSHEIKYHRYSVENITRPAAGFSWDHPQGEPQTPPNVQPTHNQHPAAVPNTAPSAVPVGESGSAQAGRSQPDRGPEAGDMAARLRTHYEQRSQRDDSPPLDAYEIPADERPF